MSGNYIHYTEFNVGEAKSTGGVTGSKKVKKNGKDYQLKPSIQDASFIRRTKAGGTDRENFGELIAATISKSIVGQYQDIELVPEISLVYDEERKKILIASLYLSNVVGTLDSFAKEDKKVMVSDKHVKVSAELEIKDNFNLGIKQTTLNFENDEQTAYPELNNSNAILRQDLAQSIALSALCGDHDVNPGNMLVVKDQQGNNRIARIDFGHAFNDLLNTYKIFGGKVRNKNNLVLDFLNREELAGFPAAQTKLWRDYQGIVPSQELVDAFKKLGKSNGLKQGLKNAKSAFQNLINDLLKDSKTNQNVLDHIKNSLIAINNNISHDQILVAANIKDVVNKSFKKIGEFYKENQKQMIDIAKLMDIQLKIDKVITSKKNHQEVSQTLIHFIRDTYAKLLDKPGIGDSEKLHWVKSSRNITGFTGTLGEFVKRRALNLGVMVEGEIKDIDNFIKKKEILNPIIRDIVNESSLVSYFLDQSIQIYLENKRHEDTGHITSAEVRNDTKQRLQSSLKLWTSVNLLEVDTIETESYKAIQEIAVQLKENIDDYVDIMDQRLTKVRDESLKKQGVNPKKAEPKELIEAMQQVFTDNIYTKMSKDIINKGYLVNAGDTIWKSLSSFCSFIGLTKLEKFFDKKNEEAKVHIIAKNIGVKIHVVAKIDNIIKKGTRDFVKIVTDNNRNKHKDLTKNKML